MVVTIPTSDAFPSLNLSQAVQIITYSLFCRLNPYAGTSNVVDAARAGKAVETCANALDGIGYFKNDDEKAFTKEFLGDILSDGKASLVGMVTTMEHSRQQPHQLQRTQTTCDVEMTAREERQ